MEESRALSRLNEATDLLALLEEILNPASVERLSQASWSGLRLTLKNARAMLQESQASLSKEFVARARSAQPTLSNGTNPAFSPALIPQEQTSGNIVNAGMSNFDKASSEQSRVQITRRDLKASLEKFIEAR